MGGVVYGERHNQGGMVPEPTDRAGGRSWGSTSQSTLQRSDDGGKTWKPLSRCGVDAMVGGLPRKLGCVMGTAQFLSPSVGFAGGGAEFAMATRMATFGKTSDGGKRWTMSVIPETKHSITDVAFWTEKDGIVVLSKGEEVYWTADGGGTWTRAVKTALAQPTRSGRGQDHRWGWRGRRNRLLL